MATTSSEASHHKYASLKQLAPLSEIWIVQDQSTTPADESTPKFRIQSSEKERDTVFHASEAPSTDDGLVVGEKRAVTLVMVDSSNRQVLAFHRPSSELIVRGPRGDRIGKVKQDDTFFDKKFRVYDRNDRQLYKVKGPLRENQLMTEDRKFKIYEGDSDKKIGKISRKFGGFAKEFFTDAQNYKMVVPPELKVESKALLLGALFLLEYTCYSGNNK